MGIPHSGQGSAVTGKGKTMTKTEQVLSALRQNTESTDDGWGMVYLDNARPEGMSEKTFRSCLAQLSKQDLYRVADGYAFGEVKI